MRRKDDKNIFPDLTSIENDDCPSAHVSQLKCILALYAVHGNMPRRLDGYFRGTMMDIGAACSSSSGKAQYFVSWNTPGREPNVGDTRAARSFFEIRTTISALVGNISFHIGNLWMFFKLHTVDVSTPILLPIYDKNQLRVFFQNLDNFLLHRDSGDTAHIVRPGGRPYLRSSTGVASHFLFSELRELHPRFFHPHVDKLVDFLKHAKMLNITLDTGRIL